METKKGFTHGFNVMLMVTRTTNCLGHFSFTFLNLVKNRIPYDWYNVNHAAIYVCARHGGQMRIQTSLGLLLSYSSSDRLNIHIPS